MALKTEAMGLAIATELPMVICDIQRGGPSTGLPTKTEQADLLQALFGRNSEAPIPVLAASTPGDCFWIAVEASRIALKYMIPVIVLTDGYLANGSEPWKVPAVDDLPSFPVRYRTEKEGFFQRRRRTRQERRDRAEADRAAAMEREVDGILAKISREGRDSLSAREKRILEQATAAKQQQYPRLSRDP